MVQTGAGAGTEGGSDAETEAIAEAVVVVLLAVVVVLLAVVVVLLAVVVVLLANVAELESSVGPQGSGPNQS
jgi:hypothetical protein